MEDKNLPPAVQQDQQNQVSLYKVLANSTKVALIKEKDHVEEYIKDQLKAVYLVAGQDRTLDPGDLRIFSKVLTQDVYLRYGGITLPEIREALQRGVRGELGEWYGLHIVTFNQWIKSYLSLEDRARALNRIPSVEQQLKQTTVSPDEAERIAQKAFDEAVEIYQNTGRIYDTGHAICSWLIRKGKVKKVTVGLMKHILTVETARLHAAIESAKLRMDREAVAKAETELRDLDYKEGVVYGMAQNQLLKEYFDSLVSLH